MDWSKTAIALSGGGSKGAYIVGVIKYLWDNHREELGRCKVVFGSSTGALIATKLSLAILTNDGKHIDDLELIYRTVTNENILKPNFRLNELKFGGFFDLLFNRKKHYFNYKSVYDSKPLQDLVDNYVALEDWELLSAARKDGFEIGFPIVSLSTGTGIVVTNQIYSDGLILRRAVIASASVPVIMPSIPVFNSEEHFVDGCFVAFNPIDVIHHSRFEGEIANVIAISTENYEFSSATMFSDMLFFFARQAGYDSVDKFKRALRVIRWLMKNKPLVPPLIWDLLDSKAVIKLEKVATEVDKELRDYNVLAIHPDSPVNINPFHFSQPDMSLLVDLGIADGRNFFEKKSLN